MEDNGEGTGRQKAEERRRGVTQKEVTEDVVDYDTLCRGKKVSVGKEQRTTLRNEGGETDGKNDSSKRRRKPQKPRRTSQTLRRVQNRRGNCSQNLVNPTILL